MTCLRIEGTHCPASITTGKKYHTCNDCIYFKPPVKKIPWPKNPKNQLPLEGL